MYDALAESVRLIETGVTAGAEPLTRRRRWLPVSYDVDGDLAVTVFLRRGHGGAFWESHVLTGGDGRWQLHGGGGSGTDSWDVLTQIATRRELGGLARSDSAGGVAVSGAGLLRRNRWAQHAEVQVAPEVASVTTPHGRALHRPDHGRLSVVWWGREPLALQLFDDHGGPLGAVTVGSP